MLHSMTMLNHAALFNFLSFNPVVHRLAVDAISVYFFSRKYPKQWAT